MLAAGAVIAGDFRVVRTLGSGAMGDVYVVEQLSTGRERAMKLMNPSVAASQQARDRFVLEARVGARIESEHVVEVVTAGFDPELGAPYLVMELLRGRDLEKALEQGPLPPGEALILFRQLGHALSRAHAMGVVHRDLKPANLFLAEPRGDSGGVPFTLKVLDFGIAKLLTDENKAQTQGVGTPLFMAPEQTQSRGTVSPATDVWALGLIAFRVLTGRSFWKARSMAELMNELLFEPIPGATARAAELRLSVVLPSGFDAWFGRSVARQPEARFAHAGEAMAALLPVLGGAASHAGPSSGASPSRAGTAPVAPPPSAPSAPSPSSPRPSGPAPGATQPGGANPPGLGTSPAAPAVAALSPPQVAGKPGSAGGWMLGVVGALVVVGALGAGLYYTFGDQKKSERRARAGKRSYESPPPEAATVSLASSPECSALAKDYEDCGERYPKSGFTAQLPQIKKDLETGLNDPDSAATMEAMCKASRETLKKTCSEVGQAPPPDDGL